MEKKICMLGTLAVGKTSLVRRFIEGIFSEKYLTSIGIKVDKKDLRSDGQDVRLVIWDIHGDDKFQRYQPSQWRGMHGYLMVVDGTRKQTLEDALVVNKRVVEITGKVPALLLINKVDLIDQWEISAERQAELAKEGWELFRTSAKTDTEVNDAFLRLTHLMLAK
ncbi:MAG: Rab family GTPase [Candidatus Acidiferrales bacterium]